MRNKVSIVFLVAAFLSAFPGPRAEASTIVCCGGNRAPVANNVRISGTPEVGQVLTGNYDYEDLENDPEGASTFEWTRTKFTTDIIEGATAETYTLVADDEGEVIEFRVTPVALRGTSPGRGVTSDPVGPIDPRNAPPVASNVSISGTAQVGQVAHRQL